MARATARRRALIKSGDADPAEEELLGLLAELAQKSHVVIEFADGKLAMLISAADGSALGASNNNSPGSSSGFQGGVGLGYHPSGGGLVGGMNRRKSSGANSNSGSDTSMFRMDVAAAESMILYLKALTFLQKGMEAARVFWQEVMVGRGSDGGVEASADLNESWYLFLTFTYLCTHKLLADSIHRLLYTAVQWFRARFNETFDKADWAKSRCAEEVPESATFAERLLYDRAMELVSLVAFQEQSWSRTSWYSCLYRSLTPVPTYLILSTYPVTNGSHSRSLGR